MNDMIFCSLQHAAFFLQMLMLYPTMDIYRRVFFYIMGLTYETRAHISELYDFELGLISPDNMEEAPWQTYTTRLVCRTAYNLYNGYCEDYPELYTPSVLFCCSFAPYFVHAIQMLYPRYFEPQDWDNMIVLKEVRRNVDGAHTEHTKDR